MGQGGDRNPQCELERVRLHLKRIVYVPDLQDLIQQDLNEKEAQTARLFLLRRDRELSFQSLPLPGVGGAIWRSLFHILKW